jgi:hypothetical protein
MKLYLLLRNLIKIDLFIFLIPAMSATCKPAQIYQFGGKGPSKPIEVKEAKKYITELEMQRKKDPEIVWKRFPDFFTIGKDSVLRLLSIKNELPEGLLLSNALPTNEGQDFVYQRIDTRGKILATLTQFKENPKKAISQFVSFSDNLTKEIKQKPYFFAAVFDKSLVFRLLDKKGCIAMRVYNSYEKGIQKVILTWVKEDGRDPIMDALNDQRGKGGEFSSPMDDEFDALEYHQCSPPDPRCQQ